MSEHGSLEYWQEVSESQTAENRQLKEQVKTLREALENIKKHHEIIGGNAAQLSSVWRIATAALAATPELHSLAFSIANLETAANRS